MLYLLVVLLLLFAPPPLLAKSSNSTIGDIGDYLQVMVPAYALGLAVNDGEQGDQWKATRQFAYSFASMQLTVLGLKAATDVERPDYQEGDSKDSFPSGHTSAAFSGATFIHKRYGFKQAIIPYALATFVGYSRIETERHHFSDVVAGATIAGLYTWLFVDERPPNILVYGSKNSVGVNYRKEF